MIKEPMKLIGFVFGALLITSPLVSAAPGDLYQADFGSGSVFQYSPSGIKTRFATGLGNPAGLAFDAQGNLFVADNTGNRVLKVSPDGATMTFASGLNKPFGVAFDASGNLYVADEGSGRIFVFTPDGAKNTFATGLSSPAGLAFDSSGDLFVSNFTAGRIDKIAPNGAANPFATGLSFPDGLAFDAGGSLLANDSGSGNVFSFTPTGDKTTFASGFFQNSGIIADAGGNVFVSENAAGTITRITSTADRSIFASGLFNPQYFAFEPSTGTRFGLLNLSTRADVLTGDNVTIGGFIINGAGSKTVLVRALGPTLGQPPFNVPGAMADPVLTLHHTDEQGHDIVIATNDNWRDSQENAIAATGKQPPNDAEAAILQTLNPGNYTAILSGANGGTGVGIVEIYDLTPTGNSLLANVSTRGFVGTNDQVMIAGLIASANNTRIVVRALGPSLANPPFNVPGTLADPVLTIFDANGNQIAANDDWQQGQGAEIQSAGYAPSNPAESALLISRPAGNTTAIVSGKNNATGVALVEVYFVP